jgi:hypothetical protein
MTSILPIGLAAGLASALLFATISSGSAFAMALFYVAPLPILIAGLGWRHYAGLVAVVIAAACLALALPPIFVAAFVVGIGLPAWLLAYLALLARPGATGDVEWYPLGNLLMWSAVVAAAGVTIGLVVLGHGEENTAAAVRGAVERVLRAQTGIPADQPLTLPGVTDPNAVVQLMVTILPPSAAMVSMLTTLLNLWGAAKVVRASGRLVRPWPDLSAIRLPGLAALVLIASVALSMAEGLVGTAADIVLGTFMLAYGFVGLSLAHAMTRGTAARSFILSTIYVAILVLGWPLLIVAVAGLVDGVLDFRRRGSGPGGSSPRSGPPAANDQ